MWAVLLLSVGLLFLIAEVFIPSGGIILVMAVACLTASVFAAFNAWWYNSPGYFWSFLMLMFLLLPVTVSGAFYLWPRTPIGRRVLLEGPEDHEVKPYIDQEARLTQLIGKYGTTLTPLAPGGIARVEGQRVHASSEGVSIESGELVKVISIRGNTLVVRRSDREQPHEADALRPATQPDSPGPLDFELPAG